MNLLIERVELQFRVDATVDEGSSRVHRIVGVTAVGAADTVHVAVINVRQIVDTWLVNVVAIVVESIASELRVVNGVLASAGFHIERRITGTRLNRFRWNR